MASAEVTRLEYLIRDVYWYNFETTSRTWESPWRQTHPESKVLLMGVRSVSQGGREHTSFRDYYDGPLHSAPPLPPDILKEELMQAIEYKEACRLQARACDDWAPGGPLYEALRRHTLVGRAT